MKRASSLAVIFAAVTLVATPAAIAKPSIQSGKNACTAEVKKQSPAPKSVRFDDNVTRITSDAFIYTLKLKNADDSNATAICTFKVDTSAATLAPAS